jgi:hypothetical protein
VVTAVCHVNGSDAAQISQTRYATPTFVHTLALRESLTLQLHHSSFAACKGMGAICIEKFNAHRAATTRVERIRFRFRYRTAPRGLLVV